MTEALSKIDQAKENLAAGLVAIEAKYPQIVRAIKKILSQPVPTEKPIIIKGKVVDHYTKYSPSMNSFYQEGVSETERVANLLFWSNKFLRPYPSTDIRSRLKNFANKGKIEEDRKTSEGIDVWIKRLDEGSKSRKFGHFGIYITNLILAEGMSFYGVGGRETHEFNAALARVVFGSLENGLSEKEVLSALKKKDFLIPYVGIDSPVTWEDLDEN